MVGEIALARAQSLLSPHLPTHLQKEWTCHASKGKDRKAKSPVLPSPRQSAPRSPSGSLHGCAGQRSLETAIPSSQLPATSWQKGYSHGPARGQRRVSDKLCHGDVERGRVRTVRVLSLQLMASAVPSWGAGVPWQKLSPPSPSPSGHSAQPLTGR